MSEVIQCPKCPGYMYHIQGLILPQVSTAYGNGRKEFYCSKCNYMQVVKNDRVIFEGLS